MNETRASKNANDGQDETLTADAPVAESWPAEMCRRMIESSPWPRRGRGSAMSETVPFGSYQDGGGSLLGAKLASAWEIWWAQLGSNQ